ncbi:hypothetical protein [Polaribacter marinivivus]
MKFERKFGKRKRTKSKKGLFLVVLLAIALYLWLNAETLLKSLF